MVYDPRRHMPRRCLFMVLLGVVTVSGVLLVPEVFVRLSMDAHEVNGEYWAQGAFAPHGRAGYVHRPGYRGRAVRPGVFDVAVAIDEHGLRMSDLPRQLAQPKRALLLGDSFTFGTGVLADQSYPARVAAVLNAEGIGVINGGQTGYDASQSAIFGSELIDRFRPEAVVLALFLHNDVEADFNRRHERVEVVNGYRLSTERLLPIPLVDAIRTSSWAWLYAERQLQRRAAQPRRAEFVRLAERDRRAAVKPTVRAVARLARECERRDISLGVVLIPPTNRGSIFDRAVMRELRLGKIPLLNLHRSFDASHFFAGDGHWNATGHERAATLVAPFVRSLIASDAPARAGSRGHDVEGSVEVVEQPEEP